MLFYITKSKLILSECTPAFYNGFSLDISAACYFLLPALVIFIWNNYRPGKEKQKYLNRCFLILISIVVLIELSGIFLFDEWGTVLNFRAFRYLLYPAEAASSLEWRTVFLFFILSAGFIFFWYFLFKKNIQLNPIKLEQKNSVVSVLIILCFTFIGMRGGFQQISLSISRAYFSDNNFLNQVALNKTWYFTRNVIDNLQHKKPFYYFPQFSANDIQTKLYPKSSRHQWLNQSKPNVIQIILEGWPADIIEPLGGMKNITPCFNSLAKDGLLFTNLYSSGSRTDQGIVALLSGFPALPDVSIVQDLEKSDKLPSLINDFRTSGYFTSFFYGGESEFCHFRSYLISQGVNKLIDKYDFEKDKRTIKWGVPDHLLFEKASDELHNYSEPFYSVILTQSSHQPYDSPYATTSSAPDNSEKFTSAAKYMDAAILKFMEKCKTEKWYNNTLFIFVSDHGNPLPLKRDYNDHERFHIPMLFYGNVLDTALRGTQNNSIANHHDLPATLLSQLGMHHDTYSISKDISATSVVPFAYWSTDNTMGWITENQKIGINLHNAEVFSWSKKPFEEEQKNGLGYIQEILKEYESY